VHACNPSTQREKAELGGQRQPDIYIERERERQKVSRQSRKESITKRGNKA
jgi:hypothetical protein